MSSKGFPIMVALCVEGGEGFGFSGVDSGLGADVVVVVVGGGG